MPFINEKRTLVKFQSLKRHPQIARQGELLGLFGITLENGDREIWRGRCITYMAQQWRTWDQALSWQNSPKTPVLIAEKPPCYGGTTLYFIQIIQMWTPEWYTCHNVAAMVLPY